MHDNLAVLTKDEINSHLKETPGWTFRDDKISKEYTFPSFSDAVAFIDDLVLFFNKMDHHPDIHIFYKKIMFDLQRFSVGGKVTELDFKVAKEIEKRYSKKFSVINQTASE